ncbi:hypothetical protein [Methanobrevibacter sp.]|uniref:hypothetical protein n=1 Tax=Methanobrevibacter sp. TaxID=66852 RepID=UPI00386A7539
MKVELIGIFKSKHNIIEGISYKFDVMLLDDYKNGQIQGIDNVFSGYFSEHLDFQIIAYSKGSLEEDENYYLNENEKKILESLEKDDVITFKADFRINQYNILNFYDPRVYGLNRFDEESAKDKINSYLLEGLWDEEIQNYTKIARKRYKD